VCVMFEIICVCGCIFGAVWVGKCLLVCVCRFVCVF
jgi:hypothetical protein